MTIIELKGVPLRHFTLIFDNYFIIISDIIWPKLYKQISKVRIKSIQYETNEYNNLFKKITLSSIQYKQIIILKILIIFT